MFGRCRSIGAITRGRRGIAAAALLVSSLSVLVLAPVSSAHAQNAVRGKTLFFSTNGAPANCGTSGCHDGFPTTRRNKINNGTNPSTTINAINGNTGGMGVLRGFVTTQDATDIAAYISNPAAADGAVFARSPTSLTFAYQTAGTTSGPMTVTVSNTGGGALSLTSISLSGTNATEFTLPAGSTCTAGGSVAAGGNCTIRVAFAPTTSGNKSATLSIAHNATGSPSTVALSGSAGTPTPTIALSATSLTFPNTPLGASSTAQTITLTNSGSAALNITALTAGGANPGDFTRAGTCAAGGSVAAGATCTIVVTFTPAATGARAASLAIASNNSGGAVTINFSGTGVNNTPAIGIAPASLAFGNQQVGTSSSARTVTVTNTGGGQLSITGLTLPGGAFAASGCAGANLSNNQSCTISVTFAPATAGAANATLSIAHNATGSPSSVALSGSGVSGPVPAVALSRASVAFAGIFGVGQTSVNERVSFTNNGPGSVNLSAIAATGDFAVVGGAAGACVAGLSVAQGASCTIDLRFGPTAAGDRTGTLTVTSSGTPADAVAALSGTGSAVAAPAVSAPAQVDFGKLMPGTSSTPQSVQLSNTGSTNLIVTSLTLAGPFTVTGPGTCGSPPFTLTPAASCTLDVVFTSATSGMHHGALVVASNGPAATVDLMAEVTATAVSGAGAGAAGGATNIGVGGGALGIELLALLALLVAVAAVVRAPAESVGRRAAGRSAGQANDSQ